MKRLFIPLIILFAAAGCAGTSPAKTEPPQAAPTSLPATTTDIPEPTATPLPSPTAAPPGHPLGEICAAIGFLLDAPSITGQMIALDAGQHLGWASNKSVSPANE